MKLEIYGDRKTYFSASGEYEDGVDEPLKHCPFCGSVDVTVHNTHTPSYWAECLSCGCKKHCEYTAPGRCKTKLSVERHHRAAFNSAIKSWNTRY